MEPTPTTYTSKCGCGWTLTGSDPEQLAEANRKHDCFEPTPPAGARWHESVGQATAILVVAAAVVLLFAICTAPEILQ